MSTPDFSIHRGDTTTLEVTITDHNDVAKVLTSVVFKMLEWDEDVTTIDEEGTVTDGAAGECEYSPGANGWDYTPGDYKAFFDTGADSAPSDGWLFIRILGA